MKKMVSILIIILFLLGCGDDNNVENDDNLLENNYIVVDTNQNGCFDSDGEEINCANSGQDGLYYKNIPNYTINVDGTITDNITDLMWQQTPDTNGDGDIDVNDKMNQANAISYCENLVLNNYNDWRLPDIKTIYSLMDFSGEDPSGYDENDTSGLIPFIDSDIFDFGYGDTDANERIIDAQWATTTNYVSTTMNGDETMFGLNLADGRIKGYGLTVRGEDKLFYVQCVRGNKDYGKNNFKDNGDLTISDYSTNLMWHKDDNGEGISWDNAIDYCESSTLAGYNDWRTPNAKELQTIVDYSKSPDTTNTAAIDELFNTTSIVNEAGDDDFGFYWTNTTHKTFTGHNGSAVYISFGRSLGYMNGSWLDVHGAGAQRSDPKDISNINSNEPGYNIVDGAITHGPQGDVIRGENFVRCVRDID